MKPEVDMKIGVTENGPYVVEGSVPLARQTIVTDDAGDSVEWLQGEEFEAKATYNLCRCGQSATKPFCDGSHVRVGFDGTETASRLPYLKEARVSRKARSGLEYDRHSVTVRFSKILRP